MSWLILMFAVYGAAVLETSFAAVWAVGPVVPLPLCAVALCAAVQHPRTGPFFAGGVGLLTDLLYPGHVGAATLVFFVAACLLAALVRRGGIQRPTLRAIWLVPFVMAWSLVDVLRMSDGIENALSLQRVLVIPTMTAVYTAGISLPLLLLLGWQSRSRADEPLLAVS